MMEPGCGEDMHHRGAEDTENSDLCVLCASVVQYWEGADE